MKFSLSWLKEHLATEADIHAVAEAMTLAGLEVEDVSDPAAKLAPFSVAKIVSAARHPNADRLQVCQVETVDGLKEIVCGAPNARAGLVTIYAPIGAYVPGLGVTLVEKPVRGVVSNGMLCSASELEQAEESDGILELPETWATGTPAATVFAAEPVIDFEVTPNRPDWLGVSGIARDLAATGLGRFIDRTPEPVPGTFACPVTVAVDGETCTHYAGRVIRGVKNGPSPQWLQDRLSAIGLKPISVLVDITNFLAYDRARPLHVFDLAKLAGSQVRAARVEAEADVLMLDGKTVRVTPDMGAILDADGVIALGGVMGGDRTKVDETTTDIFLECAWFDPIVTAQTGRTTGITSDAQYRFARGVDPEFVRPGIELATRLILDLCGGEASEVVEAGAPVARRAPVTQFDPAYVHQLTGLNLAREGVFEILRHLGFVIEGQGSTVTVHVPSWRRDVEGKADLVEEVARIAGFDALPSTPLPERERKPGGVLTPHQTRARIARRALAAMGYSEAVTWSFLKRDHAALFGGGDAALVLANPIAADLDCMRPSILPNLIAAAGRNAARGYADVALFEIGPVYAGDTPSDQRTAITALVSPRAPRHWSGAAADPLFALKADLQALLEILGAPVSALQLVQGQNADWWHPGRSARLQLGPKQVIVSFGALHPSVLKAMDVAGPLYAFELILDAVPAPRARSGKSRGNVSLSSLMPLTRDFAFVVAADKPAGDLVRAVAGADKALIGEVRVFDLYQGPGVPEGQKSVALEVVLNPTDKTLTEAEIEAVSQKIIAAASKQGASLRA